MVSKLFSLALIVVLFVFGSVCLVDNASAQQCNVQSNNSVQASQAAVLQSQALQSVLQAAQQNQGTTSAVAVAGSPQRAQQFAVVPAQRRVQVQAPLQLQAPAAASTSASAVAAIPAPQQQLALVPVAAAQPQLLACRPKLLGNLRNRSQTTTSRSVAVTRTRG